MKKLSDEELLIEIKRQWYELGLFEYQRSQEEGEESLHWDYMSMDIEEHIDKLEQEYKDRGLELPDRDEYIAQFMPDDEED